jgi:hypothetical protein
VTVSGGRTDDMTAGRPLSFCSIGKWHPVNRTSFDLPASGALQIVGCLGRCCMLDAPWLPSVNAVC